MPLLAALLALDAILHALVLWRFGMTGNTVYAVGTLIYAALAVAIGLGWQRAVWIALAIAAIGFAGLALTIGQLERDLTLDVAILAIDAAVLFTCLRLVLAR